jgi:hypothetical protein
VERPRPQWSALEVLNLRVVKLEYLDVTVLRRGVGEVRIVAGELQHADKCGGECTTRKNVFITELETSARTESKRMTSHNTPQLSLMNLANHCAVFLGLSLLNTRAILQELSRFVGYLAI